MRSMRRCDSLTAMSAIRESFDLLDQLMDAQPYRLAFWRVAGDEINYRRFFDINELAAIRTETPEVFQATHRLDSSTGQRGQSQRLTCRSSGRSARSDRLLPINSSKASWAKTSTRLERKRSPRPLYIVAEKILSKGEPLPEDWAVRAPPVTTFSIR